MDFLDSIWHKLPLQEGNSFHRHYVNLRDKYLKGLLIQSTGEVGKKDEIAACSDEYELVLLLKDYFRWEPWKEEEDDGFVEKFWKSDEVASKFRSRGNAAYKAGNLKKAARGYNLALAFAPKESSEMGLAFANRSALMMQLKMYKCAIRDIELALSNNFPKEHEKSLRERLERCAASVAENAGASEDKIFLQEEFFKLKNPSEKPILKGKAEAWVEIDFKEDRGRRLIAKEKVPAGTLILIDKPYVSVLTGLVEWNFGHCGYCSQKLDAGIPCEDCTFVFYCDETCRSQSSQGPHKYETKFLHYLQPLYSLNPPVVRHKEIQALKIIATLGPERMSALHERYRETGKIFPEDDPADPYFPIYNLISHGLKGCPRDIIEDVFKALFLTKVLQECSSFLQTSKEDGLEVFTASLILHHIWNIKYNAICLSKLEISDKDDASGQVASKSVGFSTAVYPLLSICNHSCDPNAAPVKRYRNLETALISLKDLSPGEEIFITYKPLFNKLKTSDRISFLEKSYNFVCLCIACRRNWSPKSLSLDFSQNLVIQPQSCNCFNNDKDKKCKCNDSRISSLVEKTKENEEILYKVKELIETKGDFVAAIKMLPPCLSFFGSNFQSNFVLSQVALDLYKRALVFLTNKVEMEEASFL